MLGERFKSGFFIIQSGGFKMGKSLYYVVLDFMVFDLHLKGLEKDVYAIIYGFCQAGQTFTGSLQYLADWTQSSKPGVLKVLKSLQEKGFITKEEKIINNIKFCEYRTTELTVVNRVNGVVNTVNEAVNTVNESGKQSLPNNINNNIHKNIKDNINIDDLFSFSSFNIDIFMETLKAFEEMRKKIKKPLTDKAKELIVKKLSKISNGNGDIAIEIMENSITNSWQGVFPLKNENSVATNPKADKAKKETEYPF